MMSLRNRMRQVKICALRRYYRARRVHPTTYLALGSKIPRSLKMGAYGYLGPGAIIPHGVKIGNYALIGPELLITGNDHRFDKPGTATIFSGRPQRRELIIDDDVWIGARVTILQGLNIGRGSIVAAGAVVTRNVEPYTIVAGVPARPIKKRFSEGDMAMHETYLSRPPHQGTYCGPI